jgi:hypothetical protein
VLSVAGANVVNSALLYFDPVSGDVVNGVIGGSTGYDYTQSLAVGPGNECWFTSMVTDSASYGPFLMNAGEAIRTIMGKVSAPMPGGISGMASDTPIAFPNPTDGLLMLKRLKPRTEVRLFSPDGRVLLPDRLDGFGTISLETFPAGIYLLELRSDTEVQSLKVIRY